MRYLEAAHLIQNTDFESDKSIKVFTSSELNQLSLYLRAEAAINKINMNIEISSFGTLAQSLIQDERKSDNEVLLLFPWDVLPELDWRTGGIDDTSWTKKHLKTKLQRFEKMVSIRDVSLIIYCDAPYLPSTFNNEEKELLNYSIDLAVKQFADVILPSNVFSLKNYLKTDPNHHLGGARPPKLCFFCCVLLVFDSLFDGFDCCLHCCLVFSWNFGPT